MPKPLASITYADACRDPKLFGPWFTGESWASWRVVDKALFGLPLDAGELTIFRELTGRADAPTAPASEGWFLIGRRGGKDVKAASLVTYLATIGAEQLGFRERLTRGERGIVQLLAVDRDQARVCFDYLKDMFEQPMFKRLVKRVTADSVELTNRFAIEIFTNDQRRVRGRTVVAAVLDEVAHWRSEATANPDEDVYQAIKPAMGTMMPGAMVIGISSAHARRGLLFRKFTESYGQPGNVLVVKAPTWVMNPLLPEDGEVVSAAFRDDPVWAAAEYGSEFRSDVASLVTREAVEACTAAGVLERPPENAHTYVGFVDPAGGSGQDAMSLAIAHREGKVAVLDAVREFKPSFNPEAVTAECVALLRRYRVASVTGDNFGGEWVQGTFRGLGVNYERSAKVKSALYLDLLPMLNSRGCELLDDRTLKQQLLSLERSVTRGGADKIDHAKYAHDDVANAAAGALGLATNPSFGPVPEWVQQDMASGGASYSVEDDDPFKDFSV
ncbi:MAG: hypothetical protein GEU91_16055 [Rhizobiales bacterium]|nr:hypothetical protein [Hyphomicrobiales bacterium]